MCLRALGLAAKHEGLVEAMESGFHIGNLAPIWTTIAHPNYPAASEHMGFIKAYVDEQVGLGRMSGPYSQAEVERILGSPFISSPLSVVPKANGKLRLVQDCSKEDADGLSVNGRIDADLFPTKWGSAAEVAELVSAFNHSSAAMGQGAAQPIGHRRHTRARTQEPCARAWILGIHACWGRRSPAGTREVLGTQEPPAGAAELRRRMPLHASDGMEVRQRTGMAHHASRSWPRVLRSPFVG